MTLNVFDANPGAAKRRSYLPGGPGTTHELVRASALHCAEPDAAPESVSVRPGTGPPLAEATRTAMAIGSAHGGVMQSGFVGVLHPVHARRSTASAETPRRPFVITLAFRRPPTRSAEASRNLSPALNLKSRGPGQGTELSLNRCRESGECSGLLEQPVDDPFECPKEFRSLERRHERTVKRAAHVGGKVIEALPIVGR